MVNFWATWCGPCRQEMPHLNRLYGRYRDAGFTLFGVNIDEDPAKAIGLANRLGLQFPVLLDSEKKVSRLYDLSTMPSTVLIDRDGRVRHVHLGYRDGVEVTYETQIRELLKE
jgi:thiol-disulfide isomerase/thioredoxin